MPVRKRCPQLVPNECSRPGLGDVRELLDRDRRGIRAAGRVLVLRQGPAFGSSPLATVIQDLLSIAVYLAIVVAVVV